MNQVFSMFPSSFRRRVTSPKDKVQELSMSPFGVQDLLNFKLFLTFNFDWSWGFLMTFLDLGFMIGLKQGDMENIVDLELGWKLQPASH
jgi:hypothetical protein